MQHGEPATNTVLNLDRAFLQDPHRVYRSVREEGPVRPALAHRRLRVWLVTRYAEARELLNDPRLAKDSARAVELFPPGTAGPYASSLSAHMLNSDPPDHTRLRRLVNKAFTARTVSRLRPRIEQITDGLLDDLAEAGEADLMESFAFPCRSPSSASCSASRPRITTSSERGPRRSWPPRRPRRCARPTRGCWRT
ncbi:hypothetical protein ACFQQB_62460 [Nonomuraea rubra]|uniref:hypothetical protein n=1 Tax=Nonomuraea rubra TaxID=46180 RepID=UPI0036230D9A